MGWFSFKTGNLVSRLESNVHVPWIVSSGCCQIELENAASATYDWGRLGVEDIACHPSEADILIVAGWINA